MEGSIQMARDHNPEDDDPGTLLFGDDEYSEDQPEELEEDEFDRSPSGPKQAQRSLFDAPAARAHEPPATVPAPRTEHSVVPPAAPLEDLRYQGPISMDDVEDEPEPDAPSDDTGQRRVFLTAAAIGAVIVSLFGAALYMRSSTEQSLSTATRSPATAARPSTSTAANTAPAVSPPTRPETAVVIPEQSPPSTAPPAQIAETKPAPDATRELTEPPTRPRTPAAEASHRETAPAERPSTASSGSQSPGLAQLAQRGRERLRAAPASSWTIQLLVACQSATVERAFRQVESSQLVAVPVELKGQSCYRLCWGVYPSRDAAANAISKLPSYFGSGTTPRAVSVEAVANP